MAFFLALGYAAMRAPSPPPVPGWLHDAACVSAGTAGELTPPKVIRVQGRVAQYTPLQGDRARVILTDLTPVHAGEESSGRDTSGSHETAEPYAGRVAWIWYKPSSPPLPGQIVEASLRLGPQRGMANPGAWDVETYWHGQGVWFRAWSGGRTDIRIAEGQGADVPIETQWAAARQEVQRKFTVSLPHEYDKETETTRLTRAAAMPSALLFGDRSHLSPQDSDLFARATLAHSLALSGLHLGFALLAGCFLASGLGKVVPGLWLHITRPLASLLLALPVAGLQLWLGDAPVSLVRAACMLCFWVLLLLLKRPRVLLDGLCAALAFLLLCNPFSLFEISLQLSVLSVATIALCLPGISALAGRLTPERERGKTPGWKTKLARESLTVLGISLCIQVALLPLVLRIFGSSGVLFPLNLLWLPVLGAVVMPLSFLGLLASNLGWDTLAAVLLHGATLPCQALLGLLDFLDNAGLLFSPLMPRPHWMTCAGFWLLCLILPGLASPLLAAREPKEGMGRRRHSPRARPPGGVLLFSCALALLLLPPLSALFEARGLGVRLTLLDVGQGQSVLLEWGGESSGRILVDGGGFSSPTFDVGRAIVAPVLTDNALPRLNAVIASHPDADHLSGLLFILDRFRVGRYFGNGGEASPALREREHAVLRRTGRVRETLAAGDRLDLGPELVLETLWPTHAAREAMQAQQPGREKSNNASLVLRLVWKGRPLALLCGDIESDALQQLLRRNATLMEAPVLVLPHHGSDSGLAPGLYEAVQPVLALASCGYGNQWGFPSRAVRQSLKDLGIPLLSTAESGQIRLEWAAPEAGPVLTTARQQEPRAFFIRIQME